MTQRQGDSGDKGHDASNHASRITYYVLRITYYVLRFTHYVPPSILVLMTFATLGFIYSATTPVFEAPDEVWHYNYLRYVAEGHGLPSMQNNEHGAYQEAAQPPLYYLIAALVTAPISDEDKPVYMWANPGFGYQSPGTSNDNKNMLVHTERENWPWHGFTLALHLARLVSLAFGTLTIFATWGLAGEIIPDHPNLAMAAACVVAFTPQFMFMSSVASNDSAAAALSTAALWSIIRLAKKQNARRAILAGVLIGLAWLTKTSTLLLLPLAIIALFPPARSQRPPVGWRKPGRARQADRQSPISNLQSPTSNTLYLTIITLIIGSWWYVRNLILYGDALGLSAHVNTPWGRQQTISLLAVLPELPLVYRSFWAAFGWGGIELPVWIYWVIGALVLLSLAGWVILLTARRSRFILHPSSFILLLWCLAIFAALLRWMTQVEAPHGRLLFPAIGAWAVLLVMGWAAWAHKFSRALITLGLSLLGILTLFCPFLIIRPALLPPPLLTEAQVRARADVVEMNYGESAQLVGLRLRPDARPGDIVPVTLCWQALQPITDNYSMFVHFLGKDNLIVGARDTWPGLGRFPTSLWPVGQHFCDTVRVRVEAWAPAPAIYVVEVGLYNNQNKERLELPDKRVPIVGQLIVRGKTPSPTQYATQYNLDGKIALIGYSLQPAEIKANQPFSLTLHWQAQTAQPGDYTVFVHALDQAGKLIAQNDSPPRDGQYPTYAWQKEEIVADTHQLKLPNGSYTLKIGMYDSANETRLPVDGPDGPVQDNAITLANIQVTP